MSDIMSKVAVATGARARLGSGFVTPLSEKRDALRDFNGDSEHQNRDRYHIRRNAAASAVLYLLFAKKTILNKYPLVHVRYVLTVYFFPK